MNKTQKAIIAVSLFFASSILQAQDVQGVGMTLTVDNGKGRT